MDELLDLDDVVGKGKGILRTPGKRKGLARSSSEVYAGDEMEAWIRTGDEGMDQLLGGGLRVGCLTELAGER